MFNYAVTTLLLCSLLIVSGCATPVGVNRVSPQKAYKDAYANPLNAGVASDQAKFVLNRYVLLKKFEKDPAGAIAILHEKALQDDRRDILYALAETSYLYAIKLSENSEEPKDLALAPDYYLLSAIYAYYFLLEESRPEPPPNKFDPRARTALNLYNFGLWQGFATGVNGEMVLGGGERKLPFGQLSISLDATQLPWKIEEFEKFEPADRFMVRGVSVRNRTAGVGVPFIGLKKGGAHAALAKLQAVPVTGFLRIQGNLANLSAGTATAALELYSTEESSTLQINNRTLPLESDLTTPLAYQLEGAKVWNFGIDAFLGKEINTVPDGLYLQQPYRPGKIPVVFVHGTASSPVWWTEMFNTLRFDPLVRQKYQFWYFVYTSNKPIIMSAADLRDALRSKIKQLDPEGKDPALQQMVVIGHSQGGLLTKLTAVNTGDKLLRSTTNKDLESLKLPADKKKEIKRLTYVEPLPFVNEVIFLSTPHRGSFRSKGWSRNLVKKIITLPVKLVQTSKDYFEYMTDDVKQLLGGKPTFFTSADGMSPDNPLLKALAAIPLAPGVKGHSIIAVKGDGDPKLGNDGVVEYSSAHLEGMESEFIVRSDHSSQLHPLAIDEVRRILVEHLPESARDVASPQ